MMVRKTIVACGALLVMLQVGACAQGTRKPDSTELATLDAPLETAVESRQVPAVVAMVATDEGIAYERAVGLPMDAIFAIASMTKPVTSVAVMQLVEAGKVQLDEPAHTYLPELRSIQVLENGALRPPKSPPTVRHLLSHTSGFAYEFLNREIAEHVRSGKIASMFAGTDEFLRAPLVFDPGTRWEYGISTDWAGRLVEAVSGRSLDAYFRSNIFDPLGMTDTFFNVPADKRGRVPPRYARQPDGGRNTMHRRNLKIAWSLVVVLMSAPTMALAQQCQLHFIDYTDSRHVYGPVNEECPPSIHSPGWGNWGVDSPHGGRYDADQFPGIQWQGGKLQWNSCTQDHGPDPNGYWYNEFWVTDPWPGYYRQLSTGVASHANYWTDVLPWPCSDYGTIYTISSYFMNFWEFDWPDSDDPITSVTFPSFDIVLSVNGGYRSGDSGWVNSPASGPVRTQLNMFLEMWDQ